LTFAFGGFSSNSWRSLNVPQASILKLFLDLARLHPDQKTTPLSNAKLNAPDNAS
jgi:hypothetical protein